MPKKVLQVSSFSGGLNVYADGRDASKFESCLHIMVNINEDHSKARSEADEYFILYFNLIPYFAKLSL